MNYFSQKELLRAPTNRAAFSDRMAYVMAEMSKLAYFKFEGGSTIDQFIDMAKPIVKDKVALNLLKLNAGKFINTASPDESKKVLNDILESNEYQLIATFNSGGTQAFLCRHKLYNMAVLAFRGTEKEFSDVKSDINAKLKLVEIHGKEYKVHSGYWDAFNLVRDDIAEKLKEVKDCQLFITGHSLGGALATIALKCFSGDSSGACYTFGAPPVGTKFFQDGLKTPLYRIINNIDIVPTLPNPFWALMCKLGWKSISFVLALTKLDRFFSEKLKKKVDQAIVEAFMYRHIGYSSTLIGTADSPKLRQLGFWETISKYKWLWNPSNWFSKKNSIKKFATDHSIDAYSNKLRSWSMKRR